MADRSTREQNTPEQSSSKRPPNHALALGQEAWTNLGAKTDLLGMQRTVGNQSVARMIALGGRGARSKFNTAGGPALLSRKVSPVIQRANFAQLMQFWKQQELGEAPKPQPQGKKEANNAPPEPAPIPQDVAVDNPALVEEPPGGAKSPVGGGGSVFDQPSGKGSGGGGALVTPAGSGALVTPAGSGALVTPAWSSQFSVTQSSSVDSGGGGGFVPAGQIKGNKTAVKYIDAGQARDEFELKVGGSVTQGGLPYDTSAMYSKFKGDGFAIYVMGKDGRFYSTSHKIGLFHHSSFLGGGDVAGAGEIKVVGGTIQYITNKSGHYTPGDLELSQTLHALQGASGFASASLARLMPGNRLEDPYKDGPPGFLRDHPLGGGGGVGSNKDVVKYATKPMGGSNQGEEDSSLDLVRQIIQHYVGAAQLGKLKKFNKPNPDFGKTLDDIKLLVLAEFGWNDADTVTYQAVLENWNNDRPIGDVSGAPKVPSASPPSASPTYSSTYSSSPLLMGGGTGTNSFPGGGAGTPAGGVASDGRDYDAELAELLKTTPSPDWSALGLEMTSFGWGVVSGMTSWEASAREKVWLLKGEKTINELR